ncbi:MAG: DEAD/DEAH box helicase [Hyphomicrobiaceae bacterium]
MNEFSQLGLAAPLLKALDRVGYTTPTPIQSQAIPAVMAGKDILGIAQTGTGKTAAFALPILHRLAAERKAPPRKGCRVLVLSPTRELASQIAESFRSYASHMRISVATVFGGVGHGPQIRALARGVDVLVATPGRLLDHLAAGAVSLNSAEVLVLDEADQMLDLGFVKPIRSIVSRLPSGRQTLLFSATMPDSIAALARDFLRSPTRVSVTPVASTVDAVSQRVLHIESGEKRNAIAKLIRDQAMHRTLVFTRTKRGADRVAKFLHGAGIDVAAIHGNKSQNQRERALAAFKNAKIQVLVATDIAARGIDINDVTHVINFELPEVPEAYVHRIGRTARAGASGSAISLCDRSEIKYLRGIERLIRQAISAERWVRDQDGNSRAIAMADRPHAPGGSTAGKSQRPAKLSGRRRKPSNGKNTVKSERTSPAQTHERVAKPKRNSIKRRRSTGQERTAAF